MTKLTRQFKAVIKDRLFYNRFEYVIGFTIDEASALRDLSHEEIDQMIERRIEWREISKQRWSKTNSIFGIGHHQTIISQRQKDITKTTIENLHSLATILLAAEDFKLVVSLNQAHVYTNDLSLIDQLNKLKYLTRKSYSRADVARPKNTIQLKDPKHKYRSYFKITKINNEQKETLINFLNNQYESIRISPALKQWIATPLVRTQDYFFIDHNEMSWLTMLALVRPGLIRKTQQIIATK